MSRSLSGKVTENSGSLGLPYVDFAPGALAFLDIETCHFCFMGLTF